MASPRRPGEGMLVFLLLLVAYLTVARTIEATGWASKMTPLWAVAVLGLLAAVVLARWWPAGLLRELVGMAFGLAAGLPVVWGLALAWLWMRPIGGTLEIGRRLWAWAQIARGGGISTDELPFILILLGLAWAASFLGAWAAFRYRSPWLALAPATAALLLAFILGPDTSLAVPYIFFVMAALLLMGLHLATKARRWGQREILYAPMGPPYLAYGVGVALLLVSVSWSMPGRIPGGPLTAWREWAARPLVARSAELYRLFASLRVAGGFRIQPFSSVLPLQAGLPFQENDTVVLEVKASRPGFLRGATYDEYGSTGWQARKRPTLTADRAFSAEALARLRQARPGLYREMEIAVKPVSWRPVAFTLGQALGTDPATKAQVTEGSLGRPLPPDITVMEAPSKESLAQGSYRVVTVTPLATQSRLRQASRTYPPWVRATYLQLPAELPSRVRRLAQEIGSAASNPFDKAVAVEAHLRSYPLAPKSPRIPADKDATDLFLFERKEGGFAFHASAMVVLLRAQGIPARLALGYLMHPRSFDPQTGSFILTDKEAYAWPEVFFPNLGWVEFFASPDLPSPWQDPQMIDNPDQSFWEGLFQISLTSELDVEFEEAEGEPDIIFEAGGRGPTPWWPFLLPALGVLLLLAGLALLWLWQRGMAGLAYPAQQWEKLVRLASFTGLGPSPAHTPREYARFLAEALPDAEGVEELADIYGRSRFGRKLIGLRELSALEELWPRLRGQLLGRLLRRLVPWRQE